MCSLFVSFFFVFFSVFVCFFFFFSYQNKLIFSHIYTRIYSMGMQGVCKKGNMLYSTSRYGEKGNKGTLTGTYTSLF